MHRSGDAHVALLLRPAVFARRHGPHRPVAGRTVRTRDPALRALTATERVSLAATAGLTALAGLARYLGGIPHVLAFVLAGLALAGAAALISTATEQVGARFGTATTGMLQSTIGNLPEFFVVLFALQAGELIVAQTAIVGSILVNALLVLGSAIVVGARRVPDGIMRFSPRLPNDTASLLMITSFLVVLARLADPGPDPRGHHVGTISIVGAGALLVVYGFWAWRYLTTEAAEDADLEPPRLGTGLALALLVGAGAISAFASDWFVHALEPTIRTLHISPAFAGLVIVAIAGNAVEHVVGVVLAAHGRSELAISVIKASVGQVAALLFPVLVLVSLFTATTLTFVLPAVFTGALAATALIVWQITGDGEASAFEGAALIGAFVMIAIVAAYQ